MTKSHIPIVNAPTWIEVPVGQFINKIANAFKAWKKCDKSIGLKDKNLYKRKGANIQNKSIKEINTPNESKKSD